MRTAPPRRRIPRAFTHGAAHACLRLHPDGRGLHRAGASADGIPAGSEPVTAESFAQKFAGRSVEGVRADGSSFRMDLAKDGGYLEMSRGNSTNGKWRIADGKLCTELYRANSGCNEVRVVGDVLYYKRIANGEVVSLKLR